MKSFKQRSQQRAEKRDRDQAMYLASQGMEFTRKQRKELNLPEWTGPYHVKGNK